MDAQNNIWIGTDAGLVKFNGTVWTTYNNTNSGLTANNVRDVEVDPGTNKIYAATGNAIDIYDGNAWTHINSSNSPVSASGLWAVDAKNGKIIIATLGGTYLTYVYNGTNWSSHPEPDQTYDARIDNDGNFWTAGIGVLMKFDGSVWTTYNSKNTGLTGMFNDDIFIDSRNRMWAASNDNGGINMFDCPYWRDFNPYNAGLWPQPITYTGSGSGITEDSQGDIWGVYSGALGGVVQIPAGNVNNPAAWKVWDNTNTGGVSMQFLKRAAADQSGQVWFGYEGACSVSKYNHATNSWTNYNLFQLGQITCGAGSGIKSIRVDDSNHVWVCGAAGLAKYDQTNWTFYSYLNTNMQQGLIMDIAFDSNGNKWVATEHGLVKFDNANWTTYNSANSGLLNDFVTCVVVDSSNVVWTGSYDPSLTQFYPGGLSSFDGTAWNQYRPDNSGIQEKIIDRLAFDRQMNLWIMGATHGLAIFNPNGVNGYACLDKSLTCFDVLPIGLEYFRGVAQNKKHMLTWKASCTGQQQLFEIESSSDSRQFSKIGSITSTNSRCALPFDFINAQPREGITYYRIKMMDEAGIITFSNIIALQGITNSFDILNVSPNPVKDGITTITLLSSEKTKVEIMIHDISGRVMYFGEKKIDEGRNQIVLELKDLAAGIYSLSISSRNNRRTVKLLKY